MTVTSNSGKKEREKDTNSTQSQPFAHLIHRFTRSGRLLQTKTTPMGRPTPSTSQPKSV